MTILQPEFFVNNKYNVWYCKLIGHRQVNQYQGEGEWHHFIPKSIHPNDDTVFLSLREHYVAHLLLIKCVKPEFKHKMIYALTAMKMRVTPYIKFNSRVFESVKKQANMQRSTSRKGVPRSDETKEKLRQANLGKKASAETKLKMSLAGRGRKHSPEHVEKTRQIHLGKKRSEETRRKLREDRARRVPIKCPHCNREILPGNYNRWHGDNCKFNPHLAYRGE